MAKLDGEELKKFNKLLDELNKKKDKLGQDKLLDLDGTVENLGVVNQLLDVANENLNDLNQSVEGIRETWSSVVGELKKTNDLSGSSIKSFNKLSSIADQLLNSQKGLNELSSRQITSLITKTKIEAENLKFQQKQLEAKVKARTASDKEVAALKEVNGVLGKNDGLLKQQINSLKTQEKYTRNVEKATGLTGLAMKGVSGFLSKIGMSNMGGVFEDAAEAAKATASRLTDGGKKAGGFITKIRTMGSAFKVVGKAILKNLTDPLFLAGMAMKAMKGIFGFFSSAYKKGEEAAKVISEENTNMARSLGISQTAASKLAGSVVGMGPTTAASKASIEGIYKAMGSTEKLSRNTLKVFVKLNTFAGMSAESLANFQKFAKKSGEDAGVLVTAMAKTAGSAIKNNKLAMTQRDLLEETANQSSYVKLQFAGQGPALVKAVAQSKALGLNMEKAKNMASSLLNFEDSIAKEMEAELLIGRDLNFEEARALALKGDNVGAAKAIAEQVGSAADFMNLNVIAQQALAEAAGMGVEEMSNMLSGQQDMKAEGDDLVKNQEKGIAAMTSQVSLREAAENRARKAAEANISVYKTLAPLVHKLEETWTRIKKILMDTLTDEILQPLVKFLNSDKGKKFLEELPGRIQSAVDGIKAFAAEVKKFAKDHPTIMKVLGYGLGGVITMKVLGLDKTILDGTKKVLQAGASLFSNKSTLEQKAAKAVGVELGEDSNPMAVKVINSDIFQQNNTDGTNNIVGELGKRSKVLAQIPKFLSKMLGGKNTLAGKALRDFTAMMLKRSSLINQTVKNSSALSKMFPKLSTLNSKLPQDIAKNIGKTLKVDKAGNVLKIDKVTQAIMKGSGKKVFGAAAQSAVKAGSAVNTTAKTANVAAKSTSLLSKAAPALTKTLKVLGPIGVAADLIMGGVKGAGQADLSKKEQKAAGVKEGIGKVEATALGALTGGAEKGSMFTEMVGGKKGSAGDEALGIGMAAGRGALAGAAIGSVIPVVGTAIGGAVGAVVGTVSESFKVFSDPNSSLRKGIVDFASSTSEKISGWASKSGEKISGWASSAGSAISGWASSAGEKISGWASSAGSAISGWASKAGGKLKSMVSSVGEGIKSAGGKIANFFGFATGGIATGGFQAFASGGVVTKPTFGLVGEGSMNEAIIPLPDGKSVPVKFQGGSSSTSASDQKMIQLLERLISVVEKGGDVILDGAKVGTAMAASSYRMQ
jgi:hypothetical protein